MDMGKEEKKGELGVSRSNMMADIALWARIEKNTE